MAIAGRLPGILYGTAWKKADTQRLVELAIQQGFRGIDTACQPKHYNEAGVGAGIAACLERGLARAELYVQTKFTPVSGQDRRSIPYNPSAPLAQQVARSAAVSLENLKCGHLDCLLLHSPLPTTPDTDVVWRAFERLIDAGTVHQLGISNCYDVSDLERLHRQARIKPAVVQNRFYAETGYDREIRAFCVQHGLTYQSFWTLSANPHLLTDPVIARLAAARGRTPAQILFRHLTQIGVVPLTGTCSANHMREDLSIFDFELDVAEGREIDQLIESPSRGR